MNGGWNAFNSDIRVLFKRRLKLYQRSNTISLNRLHVHAEMARGKSRLGPS